jgi:uncharacterized protein (UPF0248 family)
MNKIRDILNEFTWREKYNIDEIEIYYIHRGALNDTKLIKGNEIKSIQKTFIETNEAMIPHHRIFRIIYKNKILFERK